MKVIKHGNKVNTGLVPMSETRSFYCGFCGCVFKAEHDECGYLRTPFLPNCFCICPECGEKVWYKGTEIINVEDNAVQSS